MSLCNIVSIKVVDVKNDCIVYDVFNYKMNLNVHFY